MTGMMFRPAAQSARAGLRAGSSSTAVFAREVSQSLDETDRLRHGVDLVADLVRSCNHVGVMTLTRCGLETRATTGEIVDELDALQHETSEGPSLLAAATERTVVSDDILADRRWPVWAPAVAGQFGLVSVLSLPLRTGAGQLGVLTLYGERRGGFPSGDLELASALAAHLALALAASREIAQRDQAMASRTVIGQAEGMLMERYRVSAERAFEVLRRISQDSNTKLSAVAADLVATGDLRGLHPR